MKRRAKLLQGSILEERYRIVAPLGQGGMGAVYVAEDLKLPGKLWAVKEVFHAADDYQQFLDEAHILVQLQHPHIPTIVDYYPPNDAGCSYLVMDYVKGSTLAELFRQSNGRMSVEEVGRYAAQLCDLFQYLHGLQPQPIIYRDLKPANVMIDEQGNVKLIDFGIARHFQTGRESDTVQIGTVGFAAPEQYENKQTDARTDLYALGALIYYLLSGGQYYDLTQRPIGQLRADVPGALALAVDKLLERDPAARFQSAQEARAALAADEAAEGDFPAADTRRSPHTRLQRKTILIGGLYPGAGATFVTFAVAKALQLAHVPHAVVEFPLNRPEMYHLLAGDRSAPPDYAYAADELLSGQPRSSREWRDRGALWLPLNPDRSYAEWSSESAYKLLFAIKEPAVLIDMGDSWEQEPARQLCRDADEIVVIADNLPSRFNQRLSQQRLAQLLELKRSGKSVRFIGNRDVAMPGRNDWLRSFPAEPVCMLPNIPYEDMLQALWKGKLPQDEPAIWERLSGPLAELVGHILPEPPDSGGRKPGFFKKLFQR